MPKDVLVVEDDSGYQELLRSLLAPDRVEHCSNIEKVAERWDSIKSFDLIILDILLLGMSGLELLRRLNEEGLTKKIPVIVITSVASLEVRQQCVKLGAAGFFVKPFKNEEFLGVVQSLMGQRS